MVMRNERTTSRRNMLRQTAAGLGSLALLGQTNFAAPQQPEYKLDPKHLKPLKLKGRIKQSASRWCYGKVGFEDLCKAAKAMGLVGVDLVNNRKDWETLKQYGLQATMVPGAGTIPVGLNRLEQHDKLVEEFRGNAKAAGAAGWKNVITFSGNRQGKPDGEAIDNCVVGFGSSQHTWVKRNMKGRPVSVNLPSAKCEITNYQEASYEAIKVCGPGCPQSNHSDRHSECARAISEASNHQN